MSKYVLDTRTTVTLRCVIPCASILPALHEANGLCFEHTHAPKEDPLNPELVTFDIEFEDFEHAALFLHLASKSDDIWDVSWRCDGTAKIDYRLEHANEYN